MTDLTVYREYEPWELGDDGYPRIWHRNENDALTPLIEAALDEAQQPGGGDAYGLDFLSGVKHLVRAEAGNRCIRCFHPYRVGAGGYSEVSDADAAAVDVGDPEHPTLTSGTLADPDQVSPKDRAAALRPTINWSSCDTMCRHPGPARARVTSDRPWQARNDASIDMLRFAISQGNEVQAAWRILTVHHLNGRKHDLRWFNLAALCQRCHLHIQKKVVIERVYPFEHTPWFQPYAAGWYAHAYLGQNLTRAQVLRRLPELLALERMA